MASKSRSNQGRGSAKKRGKTAGKGFVAPRASRSDKKAIGKALGKVAMGVAPGGLAAKGVASATRLATMAGKARKSGRAATEAAKRNPSMQSPRVTTDSRGNSYVSGGVMLKNKDWGTYLTAGRPRASQVKRTQYLKSKKRRGK